MALRIRTNGRILCAAMFPVEEGDVYIDDNVHYTLSAEHKLLVTESMEGGHAEHGEWWFRNEVPPGVIIDPYYLK